MYYFLCITFTDTFILRDCTVTSPSIGTIRVSCGSPYQILVTLTPTNNCNNPMVTSNGSSPLTVRGLDPGMMYSVMINVFDGNQVVLRDYKVTKTITVTSGESGKVNVRTCALPIATYCVIQSFDERNIYVHDNINVRPALIVFKTLPKMHSAISHLLFSSSSPTTYCFCYNNFNSAQCTHYHIHNQNCKIVIYKLFKTVIHNQYSCHFPIYVHTYMQVHSHCMVCTYCDKVYTY